MTTYTEPFTLSATGSTRATAYNWGNKVVTRDGLTHVVWLDAVSQVCGRTLDHATGEWGSTHRLFEGCDNHANPSITADRDGHLRLVYGPHGWWGDWNQARVKWHRSQHSGSLAEWGVSEDFGYNATAAAIVHTTSGLDAVVCRGGEYPPCTVFQRQRSLRGWTHAKPLFHQDIEPQYTHHYGHILCDDEGTLYAACHFYNVGGGGNPPVTGDRSTMRSYGMAVLKSCDLGGSWTNLAGEPVHTPALYEERIAVPPPGANMYVEGVALDPAGGLWALAVDEGLQRDDVLLSRWTSGGWVTTDVAPHLPAERQAVYGSLTIDARGGIHVALAAVKRAGVNEDNWWGHPSCEVFHIFSADGGHTCACQQVSEPDDSCASWLPSLPKHGPFHPVTDVVLMYTHGHPGQGCLPDTTTEVRCVRIGTES